MEINTNTTSPSRTRSERSWAARFFVGLFKLLFLLVAIAAGVLLGWLGWQQLSYINTVNDVQNQRISRIDEEVLRQNDVESLIRTSTTELRGEISALSGALDDLTAENQTLRDSLAAQAADITALEGAQEENGIALGNISTSIDSLGSGLLALQSDISTSGSDVDSVGATVDDLLNEVETLSGELEALQASLVISPTTADGEGVPVVTLAPGEGSGEQFNIWRLWGLVMRTKLHLAENDIDAAEASLASAQTAIADLLAGEAGDLNEDLTAIEETLATAAESISSKPAVSNRTLDEALDALDALLTP